MRATILGCTLKRSPERSNSEALAEVLIDSLESDGVACELVRLVDLEISPGVDSDLGDGDEWPQVRERIVASEILIFATPTWLGRPSSVAQRALERMDALLSETDDWTYWNRGPGPGEDYLDTGEGHGWSDSTGRAAAQNLLAAARALSEKPISGAAVGVTMDGAAR